MLTQEERARGRLARALVGSRLTTSERRGIWSGREGSEQSAGRMIGRSLSCRDAGLTRWIESEYDFKTRLADFRAGLLPCIYPNVTVNLYQ